MRRLSHDRMLNVLIGSVAQPDDVMDRLADRLTPFHRDAASPCRSTARGDVPSDTDVAVMHRQREHLEAESPGLPEGALITRADTTPDGYTDLVPGINALRGAGLLIPRITGSGDIP